MLCENHSLFHQKERQIGKNNFMGRKGKLITYLNKSFRSLYLPIPQKNNYTQTMCIWLPAPS